MAQLAQKRIYDPAVSVVFLKTNETFGGLSNMAPGFPIRINSVPIRTSEALYQICRFPNDPEIQELILAEKSPMTAKMRSKPYRDRTRPDWMSIRVSVMRWCLRVKLAQNMDSFGSLLLSTGEKPIVEKKVRRQDFWGAKEMPDGSLVGENVLGRLLMELRDCLQNDKEGCLKVVLPPDLEDFKLLGDVIGTVTGSSAVQERQKSLF